MTGARTTRSDDLALIAEHHESFFAHRDLTLFRDLFRKLAWDAFTDEAIEDLADRYAFAADERERRNAESRALAGSSDLSKKEAA